MFSTCSFCFLILKQSRTEFHSRRSFIKRAWTTVKKIHNKKRQEARDHFQKWSETENRGYKYPEYMRAWVIEEYGKPEEVLRLETLDSPSNKFKSCFDARRSYLYQSVHHPNDVLVKIHAASLNPIDIRVSEGFGAQLFNFQRNMIFNRIATVFSKFKDAHDNYANREFPLILGRDFSGTVVEVGANVFDIQPGDEVYGAPNIFLSGTLADFACVDLRHVAQRPATLSHIEAASLPYVGLTVTAALRDLVSEPKEPKRALVLGGAGGVGTFAIQYLQAYGFSVTTTCSGDGVQLCNKLGADCIDYALQDVDEFIRESEKFTIVFDPIDAASPEWATQCLYPNGTYVALHSPIIELGHRYGPILGGSNTFFVYAKKKFSNSPIDVKWAYFKPDRQALLEIARIVDSALIKPVVNPKNIFAFEDVPKAFQRLSEGHARGKIIVNVSGLPEAVFKPAVQKIIHL